MLKETTKLMIQEEIPEDDYTMFAKLLGQALIKGDFKTISNYFNSSSELIISIFFSIKFFIIPISLFISAINGMVFCSSVNFNMQFGSKSVVINCIS